MSDTGETRHSVQRDQNEDTKEVAATAVGTPPNLLPILPILLGVFICALNICVAIWLWNNVFRSSFPILSRGSFPTTVATSLMAISLFVGLFLIMYGIVLRRAEQSSSLVDQIPNGSRPQQTPIHVPAYVRWVLAPVLLALSATAVTVWATQMIESIAPTPCIELYQEATNISNINPAFKMPWTDRDQLRCNINAVLSD